MSGNKTLNIPMCNNIQRAWMNWPKFHSDKLRNMTR